MEDEVLDYVMNTPENTNPAILKQMLKQGEGDGGNSEPLIVNATETGLDASYNEIKTAALAGKTVFFLYEYDGVENYSHLTSFGNGDGAYNVLVGTNQYYTAEDPDTDMSFFSDGER